MKIVTIAAVILIAVSAAASQTEKQIAAIRAEVNLINKNAPSYQKKTKNLQGISLEGTAATYFISGKGLKKITAKIYGETFRAVTELFYSGEDLLFAYQRLEKYDTHVAMNPPPKVASLTETRVYFFNQKAVRVLIGKSMMPTTHIKFTEAEMEMVELSDQLKAGLTR